MSDLDRAQSDLEHLLKGTLEINAGLESVMRTSHYKKMQGAMASAMKAQVRKLLNSDVFKQIDAALGPAVVAVSKATERITTESDDLEIYDAVQANLPPLNDHKIADALADFLILVYNFGGQDFLNKHNIPATFELKNDVIINNVKTRATTTLSGVDETTTKRVVDAIKAGRDAGLSNADIASGIRDSIPETYDGRAETIVRTETSNMVGTAEADAASMNGASSKQWVTVGACCDLCADNESQGIIGIDEVFNSGDDTEPAHPNCKCVVEYFFTPFMGTIWSGD